MSLWMRIIWSVSPELQWRAVCPHTIESIARDFVDNHLPSLEVLQTFDFGRIYDGDPWFAWRRRICAIYGVATCYQHPRGEQAKPGWNRRLWTQPLGMEPEQLVDQIFETTINRLRESIEST